MMSCDSDTDIEDEFFTALTLFKSTARNSEAKLREMLLTAIAKRTKFFNHDIKIPFPASIRNNLNEMSETKINVNIEKQLGNFENILCDSIDEENSRDSSDIPTISIPDEEFTDFTTCKICDGAKIGPFILLECQECLDTYHPLCHQPPVIEIDVYDPRLVWRCSRCTNVSEEIPPEISPTLNSLDENVNIINNENKEKTEKINENTSVKSNSLMRIKNNSYMCNNIEERGTLKDTIKEEYSSLGNQLRKRIGSKLTVSRARI